MLYVFQLKPFKEWSFDKLQILIGRNFAQKIIVFQWKQFKTKFSLSFYFAFFDSLKAVICCF